MSFSFGHGTTTGNTFGTPTATDNKPNLFGSPTTGTPGFGAFSFGAKTTTAPSLFSTPTATTAASAFGAAKPSFGFTSPPNQTVGSPGFGQAAQQQSAPLFGVGQQTQAPAFGAPSTQATATPFGSPQASFPFKPGTGQSLATPISGFSAPQLSAVTTSTAPQTTQPTFSLGTATTNASTPAFGQAAQGKPAFSFGGLGTTTTSAGPAFGGASGFSFGGTANTNAQQTPAFGQAATTAQQTPQFGQPTQSTAQPFAATQSALNLTPQTTQTGLSFGTTTQSQPLSFGTTPQATQATSFGITPQATQATSFGVTPQTTQATLSFGSKPQTTAALSFGTTPQTSQPSFGATTTQASFGTTTQSQATSLSFGTTQPSLSFGTTVQSSQPATFGTAPISQTTSQPTPSFGTTQTTQSQPALSFGTTQTTPSQPTLSFGTTKPATTSAAPLTGGLKFGATTTSGGLSFGTTTTTASTGLNIGTSGGLSFGKTATTSGAMRTKSADNVNVSSLLNKFNIMKAELDEMRGRLDASESTITSTSAPSGVTAPGQTSTSAALPTLNMATTNAAAITAPTAVSSVTFAQLEESINKWTLELEEQERTFIGQATQINAWDRLLISNGEKIVELNDAVETVKNEQQSLEHELDFVLAQQKELEELLAPLEKQLADGADRMRDPEREHMYSLAESLDTQLRQMSEDLKEVIEHLNETNRSQDSNDPIVQIGRILNAHMSSMQWIDNSIAQITDKLDTLKATHDTLRRDNERSFHLTYN